MGSRHGRNEYGAPQTSGGKFGLATMNLAWRRLLWRWKRAFATRLGRAEERVLHNDEEEKKGKKNLAGSKINEGHVRKVRGPLLLAFAFDASS